jgi:hypothetical protein
MFDNFDTIEEVIDEIRNGKTLTKDRMQKFSDDLLYDKSSDNACRVFLVLAEKKVLISDLVFDRLCNIIMNNHQNDTKENSIRTIDILIENGQNPSHLCLNALSIALQDQQTPTLRRYGSKILYTIIKKQSVLRLNSSLLNAMSHALNDPLTTVQTYALYSFEELVRNQSCDIPQQSIDSIEALLSNIYQDIGKNYGKCGLMASFFLNLLYRQYKLNENLLEIFSELLIIEVDSHKDLSLNRSASYVLQKAIENSLFFENLTPKVLNNISICFNSMSSQHKEMLEYCLRILCALNEDQLMSTRLDTNLLKHYLKDTNLEEGLRSYVAILLGNLCKIPYQNVSDDSNMSIVEDTIDILIEGLDHEKLLQSSIYALKSIAQYEQDYLSIFPLRKFIVILNKDDLNKEIRQNVCWILVFAIQNRQPLTKYEIDGLENALNDSDFNICNIALIAFQYFYEIYTKDYFTMMKSSTKNISILSTELLLNSNETIILNASKLLKIIIQKHLKTEFTYDEINNLCITLQTNLNESIRQLCFYSLNQIILNQSNFPKNVFNMIQLEKTTQHILTQQTFNEPFYINQFEDKLRVYLNDTIFIPMNVFEVFNKILNTNSYNSSIILILLQYVKDDQKLPNYLNETLTIQLSINKNIEQNEILNEILYYIIYNGQTLNNNMIQLFNESFLKNSLCSIYTIQIYKLLTNRNEIQLDAKIYKKILNLLKNENDYDIQINLIETLAYSIENTPISSELPSDEILKLIEEYFQNDTTKEIKYYCCKALSALIEHRKNLSHFTLELLKVYAQDDEFNDEQIMNLRDIAIDTLKKYILVCKIDKKTLNLNEIEQIINEEMLGHMIEKSSNLEAVKQLLILVENEQKSLSKYNMKVLESSFYSNNSSLEFKLIIIKIFQSTAKYLQQSQIDFIINLINENFLSQAVINVIKELVKFQKSFSSLAIHILINFASENQNPTLRDNVIDSFKSILQYETIPPDIIKLIRFEILSQSLRNPTFENKKSAINTCLEFAQNGYKLSTNILQSFEYILNNPLDTNEIGETVLEIIQLANQKIPSTLVDRLSYLFRESQLNKNCLIKIIKNISINNQELITQEIVTNTEQNLSSDSYSILLKGTQNGCQLKQETIENFTTILAKQDNTNINQRLNIIEILKNLAANTQTLNDDVIKCLENALIENNDIIQKQILNVLKHVKNYKPSANFFKYLQQILEQHPLELQIGNILEKSLKLPIQVTLHIVHIFLVAEYIQQDISEKPLELMCRELLCSDLLARINKHNRYDALNQFEFCSNLTDLEDYFHFPSHCLERDEILIFLIENCSKFTLKTINDILLLIKTNNKALQILHISSNDWLTKLRINWLYTIFDLYKHIKTNQNFNITDEDAEKIVDLLLIKLSFSVSLSESFLQRLCQIENANELIIFLEFLCEKNIHKQIDLGEYFTKKNENKVEIKDLYSWALDIQCDLIEQKFLDLCKLGNFNQLNVLKNIRSAILVAFVNGWSLEVFQRLFHTFKAKQNQSLSLIMENFYNTLTVINNYEVKYEISDKNGNNAESIFNLKNSNEWSLYMHTFAVSVSFDGDEREKSIRDLIDELRRYVDFISNLRIFSTCISNIEMCLCIQYLFF